MSVFPTSTIRGPKISDVSPALAQIWANQVTLAGRSSTTGLNWGCDCGGSRFICLWEASSTVYLNVVLHHIQEITLQYAYIRFYLYIISEL